MEAQSLLDEIQGHPRYSDFRQWLAENLRFFQRLIELARQTKASGHQKYGFRALWEVARWEEDVHGTQVRSNDGYRLNNNLVPLICRAVILAAPDLDGFFALRGLSNE